MKYAEFFKQVTGRPPFPYQERLACGAWPALLDVPTGLGKTAAVCVAWIYKRLQGDTETGRRLVYCLPMRVLVEQTTDEASSWCAEATPLFEEAGLLAPTVHVLMGGEVDESWEREPERPSIVVGTQDMLLSRALNRGYAMSRYKWPVHFALLNNDCLWVLDETQLIGVGIETSAQLQGLRDGIGVHASSRTLWMSATLGGDQLSTVDHPQPTTGWPTVSLTGADAAHPIVQDRTRASKPIAQAEGVRLDKSSDDEGYVEALADCIFREHASRGGLSLAIVNRVSRAQALYQAIRRGEGRTAQNTALVHSRFRGADRAREEAILRSAAEDRIVVATQAVEAGVDVSSRTMFTELAPWPSLVQRFGRCNRYGNDEAAIFWVDMDTEDDGLARPYAGQELMRARGLLGELAQRDAGPQSLREVHYDPPHEVRPVLRRRDLLDLFDTTPDLRGNDIDVSRYVRDGEDTDVQVYWRDFETIPTADERQPERFELCRVPVAAARQFIGKLHKKRDKLGRAVEAAAEKARLTAWSWSPLARQWQPADRIYPGQVMLLHPTAGGYDPQLGWTGEVVPKVPTSPVYSPSEGTGTMAEEGLASDPRSSVVGGVWVRLPDHLAHVQSEAASLAGMLQVDDYSDELRTAGLWHDVGKAHEAFQHKLLDPVEDKPEMQPTGAGPWAKSSHKLKTPPVRAYFRHELASALAWLQAGPAQDNRFRDLVAYLVAAHHGKVRMSIRSVPGEAEPDDDRLFAQGVWDGDTLQPFDMPTGQTLSGLKLDLSVMRLGQQSWLQRMLRIRDDPSLGPFRLALLETIVRIADWRASRKEQEGGYDGA